ncbi:MAG: TonB-dependent receptor plug domain-containing protein, partial [Nitrospirota bacterium]|nr:TonB-dependent receptor plug domain-containing protein [Nitrospirota bacterium]
MKFRIKICGHTVVLLFVALLTSQLLFSDSLASEPNNTETLTIQELLLFYDLEDLIEVTSRRPTKIKHVAENISIITAEEIRQMNAHSVNEILRIVTGMHIDFNEYFAGTGVNSIHTSRFFHNLILLDGVRINDVGEGYTYTTGIPVQIIDRIEIVKGPASSAWGSALGGVINIITKSGKEGSRPA